MIKDFDIKFICNMFIKFDNYKLLPLIRHTSCYDVNNTIYNSLKKNNEELIIANQLLKKNNHELENKIMLLDRQLFKQHELMNKYHNKIE